MLAACLSMQTCCVVVVELRPIFEINRICHRSLLQTEKSQQGKRIMPETRFTEFSLLSVDPRVGISQSASKTDV